MSSLIIWSMGLLPQYSFHRFLWRVCGHSFIHWLTSNQIYSKNRFNKTIDYLVVSASIFYMHFSCTWHYLSFGCLVSSFFYCSLLVNFWQFRSHLRSSKYLFFTLYCQYILTLCILPTLEYLQGPLAHLSLLPWVTVTCGSCQHALILSAIPISRYFLATCSHKSH